MLEIFCDGGASPNPGHGGIGFLIKRNDKIIIDGYQYLGDKITNNQAEFSAIINSLGCVRSELPEEKKVVIYSDSNLVVKSSDSTPLSERFVIKEEILKTFLGLLQRIVSKFDEVIVKKIDREENKLADKLSQIARETKRSKIIRYAL